MKRDYKDITQDNEENNFIRPSISTWSSDCKVKWWIPDKFDIFSDQFQPNLWSPVQQSVPGSLNSWLKSSVSLSQILLLNWWDETMWGINRNKREKCWLSWKMIFRPIARLYVYSCGYFSTYSFVHFLYLLNGWIQEIKRILSSDWLPERARDFPRFSHNKNSHCGHILNPLLTKPGRSRRLNIVLFFGSLMTTTSTWSMKTQERTGPISSHLDLRLGQ